MLEIKSANERKEIIFLDGTERGAELPTWPGPREWASIQDRFPMAGAKQEMWSDVAGPLPSLN